MTAASEKTIARLTGALKRHDVGELREQLLAQIAAGVSQTQASAMIDLVEALPKTEAQQAAEANRVTVPGYYHHPVDDRVVKVQRSRKGYLYALELDGPKPRFVSGLLAELDATRVAERPATVKPDASKDDLMAALALLSQRRNSA